MSDTIELFPDSTDEWRWRRISENGRIVSSSGESFYNKWGAKRAARAANTDFAECGLRFVDAEC